jgi:hypothetical protein
VSDGSGLTSAADLRLSRRAIAPIAETTAKSGTPGPHSPSTIIPIGVRAFSGSARAKGGVILSLGDSARPLSRVAPGQPRRANGGGVAPPLDAPATFHAAPQRFDNAPRRHAYLTEIIPFPSSYKALDRQALRLVAESRELLCRALHCEETISQRSQSCRTEMRPAICGGEVDYKLRAE